MRWDGRSGVGRWRRGSLRVEGGTVVGAFEDVIVGGIEVSCGRGRGVGFEALDAPNNLGIGLSGMKWVEGRARRGLVGIFEKTSLSRGRRELLTDPATSWGHLGRCLPLARLELGQRAVSSKVKCQGVDGAVAVGAGEGHGVE